MEIKKSSGANQSLKNVEQDITTLETKNQYQLPVHANELQTFFHSLFCKVTGGYISLRGFHLEGGVVFAESYLFNDPILISAASRLATHASSIPGVVFCSPTATFKESDKANGDYFWF